MALSKKISEDLLEEDDIPEEIEHDLIKDSVLQIVNTDFKVTDEFDDLPAGEIRLNAAEDLSADYEGKPISRKSFSQRNWIDENSASDLDSGADEDNEYEEVEQFSGDESEENEDGNEETSEEESQKSDGESESGSIEEKPKKRTRQETGDINIFSSGMKNVADDIKKGNAIKNQLVLWESIIECRIKLQKGLASCNRLPQKQSFSKFLSQLTPEEKSSVNSSYEGLINLLENFIKLRECLLKKCPDYVNFKKGNTEDISFKHNLSAADDEEITSESENEKEEDEEIEDDDVNSEEESPPLKKRKTLEDYSECLTSGCKDYKKFRDFVIQKWNDKTRLASGKSGISKFAILEQSTLKQIDQILLDKDRLLKRTQTRRSKLPILGKEKKQDEDVKTNDEKNMDDDVIEDEVQEKESSAEVLDAEIFDDDDFYHKLLKDFIDRKTSDVTDPTKLGRQWTQLQKLRSKMKRKIDTRATKGRKIRYTVHNQLVNFMAPIPYCTWDDKVEQDLFRSLFGQASQSLPAIAPFENK